MSIVLRITLILVSVLVVFFVLSKIRKAKLNIDDAIYWIIFALFLLLLSIFPGIAIYVSSLLGIESPANFVFLFTIFLVLIKQFTLSIEISLQKRRLNSLIQKLALSEHEKESDR